MYLTNIPPKTICVVRKKIGTSNILEIACEHFQKNSQNMRSLRYMRRVEKSWAWVFFLATGYNGSFQVSLDNKKVSKNTSALVFETMILSSRENDFSEIATPTQNWVFFCTEVGLRKLKGIEIGKIGVTYTDLFLNRLNFFFNRAWKMDHFHNKQEEVHAR